MTGVALRSAPGRSAGLRPEPQSTLRLGLSAAAANARKEAR